MKNFSIRQIVPSFMISWFSIFITVITIFVILIGYDSKKFMADLIAAEPSEVIKVVQVPKNVFTLFDEVIAIKTEGKEGELLKGIEIDLSPLLKRHPDLKEVSLFEYEEGKIRRKLKYESKGQNIAADLTAGQIYLIIEKPTGRIRDAYNILGVINRFREQIPTPLMHDICEYILCPGPLGFHSTGELFTKVPELAKLKERIRKEEGEGFFDLQLGGFRPPHPEPPPGFEPPPDSCEKCYGFDVPVEIPGEDPGPPAQPTCCNFDLTGSHLGRDATTHTMAYDGNMSTFFKSSYYDWQYIQIDFDCEGTFSAFRRYMSRDGTSITGNRASQGEGVSYSLDGINWTNLTGNTTTGWGRYTNYAPHAWHTVNYGWSDWLYLNTPVQARHVRFNWDGGNDAVNEIETVFFVPEDISDVTGSHRGGDTDHAMAYDANMSTFFKSKHDNWQHIQIDFYCEGTFSAFRRYMSRDGTSITGNRASQGEGVSYSLDGINWINLTGTTTGWGRYNNYRPHAWHTINYGWSDWLYLNTPVQARHVRFNWDGDNDAVNEIETVFFK